MKKTAYTLLSILLIGMLFVSCSDDDENDVTDEWKNHQLSISQKAQTLVGDDGKKVYKALESKSGLGYVYYRSSDYITKRMTGDFSEKEPTVFAAATVEKTKPEFVTDIVEYRYEVWFYDIDDKRILFDSTEFLNNNRTITRALNDVGSGTRMMDGMKTVIMDMEVGEERIACVRHELAYGIYGGTIVTATSATSIVKGHTTLFYDIKLLGVRSK